MPPSPTADEAGSYLERWHAMAQTQDDAALAAWMRKNEIVAQLNTLFRHSPYLSRLILLHPSLPYDMAGKGPDAVFAALLRELPVNAAGHDNPDAFIMRALRVAKGKVALLTALADIQGMWALPQVTAALSAFADRCVGLTLDMLLSLAHRRGEIELAYPASPSKDSGIIVLALGKLGSHSLNYSSDIDLIVFFEHGRLAYKGRHNTQHFMNKLAHDLVRILQDRTPDGYVFRTDLRLRPDPASTPPAISTDAAYYYYESVGQNWERAAMIKARPIAGDMVAGELFLKRLAPFMWRRSLDFASIQDIHSIKRQMDSRQNKDIRLKGHHIKLGMGGIREIEFFAQIHQLIWGGREPSLRTRGTMETLGRLAERGLVDANKAAVLKNAYVFLRTLEHRLQMVDDEQTHTLPDDDGAVASIAGFMGYPSVTEFEKEALAHLHAVHTIYASSFKESEGLGDEGNLVFTGTVHDPDTLETLRKMGYANPETVSEIVMGWHHGSTRATRTKRARELLTELMPAVLKQLSETANPDAAFLKFDEFLRRLPAGIQLFSLFQANPQLLKLIADIMGSAPTLAEHLSKSPNLLDAVIYGDFYAPLPAFDLLSAQWRDISQVMPEFEERLLALTRFRNEKQFQAGVHLLKGKIDARTTGKFLAGLAELVVQETLGAVSAEFEKNHGRFSRGQFAVIGLGKLGSSEMTFSSDIDLVFVYDVPDADTVSSGEKGLSPSVYYNRLAQRLLNTLSAMSREGRLYEVDTRLRPSGSKGVLAVSMAGLEQYFSESAWTFEYMALTRARAVAGDDRLKNALTQFIHRQLEKPRDPEELRKAVIDMRERIDKEFGEKDPWHIKYVRGGLMDLDFIAQYLLLLHAPNAPDAQSGGTADIYVWLKRHQCLPAATADALMEAERFLVQLFNMLRLCISNKFDEASAPPGLKKLLHESVSLPDFDALKKRLVEVERQVYTQYTALLNL